MARIYPLFSSSSGNSIFVGGKNGGVLIDDGVSYKRLCAAMQRCGLEMDAIKAVFITHDHSDHIGGLKTFSSKHNVPVYALPMTAEKLIKSEIVLSVTPLCETVFVEGMEVSFFRTPHDTDESCGYRIKTADGKVCAVCTDLGHITDEVDNGIFGCDLVMIEANYDVNMLKNGPYPFYLKTRISSERGHLSNDDCARQIERLIENGTMRFVLGHLSQHNNTPEKAESTIESYLKGYKRNCDYILNVAPVETEGECMIF